MSDGTRLDTLFWELEVRTARIEAAEAEGRKAGEQIGKAIDEGAKTAGQKGASQWVDSLMKDLRERREEIKQQAVAGLLTTNEAAAAGRAVSKQFVKELTQGLGDLKNQGVIKQSDFPALLGQAAPALRLQREEAERLGAEMQRLAGANEKAGIAIGGTGKAATEHAIPGLSRLNSVFETVIHKATETSPAFAKVAGTLLELGAGGLIATAVLAGLAAIAIGYNKLTEGAREAAKKVDDLTKSLLENRKAAIPDVVRTTQNVADAQTAKAIAARRVAELETPAPAEAGAQGVFLTELVRSRQLAAARKDLAEKTTALTRAQVEVGEAFGNQADKEASALGKVLSSGNATNDMRTRAARLVHEYNKEIADLIATGRTDEATLSEINALQARIDDLTAADKKAEKTGERAEAAAARLREAQQRAREAFASATAGFTAGKEDDLEHQITKLVDAAQKAKIGSAEISKRVQVLRSAAADALKEETTRTLRDLSAQSTVTAVDDLSNALDDLKKKMREKGASQDLIDQVTAIQQPMIDATKASEDLQKALDVLKRDTAEGFNLKQNLGQIQPRIDAAIAARNAAPAGSQVQAKAQKDLDDLLALELQIREKIRKITLDTIAHTKTVAQQTGEIAGGIANAANAAFGLASAFIGVDDRITKVLGSIGQLAGGIQSISSATSFLGALPGLGQALGGAIALGDALFGQSPEEKARSERIKENTEAILQLTNRIGDLGKNVTGTDVERVKFAATEALAGRKVNAEDFEKTFGISLLALQEFAKALGISIGAVPTLKELQAVLDAIAKNDLGQFADTFAGQMAKLNDEIKLFDIKDPIEQFRAFRKALDGIKDKGGILSETIDKFDLSNPGGVAAAIKALQDLFTQVTSGAIDSTQFGGLNGQELIDAILRAVDLLKAGPGETGAVGTGGFNVVRTITEVTGSRIGALLSTANVFAEMTAKNTGVLAQQYMDRAGAASISLASVSPAVSLVSPPSIDRATDSSSVSGPATSGITIGDVTINVHVQAGDVANPEELGRKLAHGFVQKVSEGMANAVSWKKRGVGNVVVGTPGNAGLPHVTGVRWY